MNKLIVPEINPAISQEVDAMVEKLTSSFQNYLNKCAETGIIEPVVFIGVTVQKEAVARMVCDKMNEQLKSLDLSVFCGTKGSFTHNKFFIFQEWNFEYNHYL